MIFEQAKTVEDSLTEEFYKRCYATQLEYMRRRVTDKQIFDIKNQIVNMSDNNGLLKLNDTFFYHYQLNLEALTI